jgi:gas vesicle protein
MNMKGFLWGAAIGTMAGLVYGVSMNNKEHTEWRRSLSKIMDRTGVVAGDAMQSMGNMMDQAGETMSRWMD